MNPRNPQAGMTLLETMIAVVVLAIGVTAVAAVYSYGILTMGATQDDLVAKVKAQEAIESVFTARDTRILVWAQILNVQGASGADGGVFQDGPLVVRDPGPDGLVNTVDDGAVQTITLPGQDNVLGTADDVIIPLVKFQREIRIRDVAANLRSIQVIMTYTSGRLRRTYTLTTYISPFA